MEIRDIYVWYDGKHHVWHTVVYFANGDIVCSQRCPYVGGNHG